MERIFWKGRDYKMEGVCSDVNNSELGAQFFFAFFLKHGNLLIGLSNVKQAGFALNENLNFPFLTSGIVKSNGNIDFT